MVSLPGYDIKELLYEGEHSMIVRATSQADHTPVIIKLIKDEFPTDHELGRYKREYQILSTCQHDNINRVYRLEKVGHALAIIMEDMGGTSLDATLKVAKLRLREFLEIAIKIVEGIAYIHSQGIVHKDINPANIIWNTQTRDVKLIDFGIASTLARENPDIHLATALEGTLDYLSPEQTGRMNRGVDYRSDFYSLGMTFYHMLTGIVPFQSDDAMTMVHYHIAKLAIPPKEINPTIPEPLSDIVMKLIAKAAEDRYQTAKGLLTDLKTCLMQLEQSGTIKPFPLAAHDVSEKFAVPEKLYGREEALATLLQSFDEVSHGQTKLLLIGGSPGIGKSALVHEVHKPMAEKHGYLISGKFDHLKKDIPYASLAQALEEWVRQIMMEGETTAAFWREKLTRILGTNGGVVTEIVPALESLIGQQPKPAELGYQEHQQRFQRIFLSFIQALATPQHPLVIFLDDLQWVDQPSLHLIQQLLTHRDTHYILLIGAYRSNEVDQAHLLTMTLDELKKAEVGIQTLTLKPLSLEETTQLIADTLHTGPDAVNELSALCFNKTQGNPFFLNQLLLTLYQDRHIHLDDAHEHWTWDLAQVKSAKMADNVIDLMVEKIHKLTETSQQCLQLAACIGYRFDLTTLSWVLEKPLAATAEDLWEALKTGLIMPEDEAYKYATALDEGARASTDAIYYRFSHDRIQQAAYANIPAASKEQYHHRIGQMLLANIPEEKRREHIFTIVNQLNAGLGLTTDAKQIKLIAELNLTAAQRAQDATAFKSAIAYLQTIQKRLPESMWEEDYTFSKRFYKTLIECLCMDGQLPLAEATTKQVLDHMHTPEEKAMIHAMLVKLYTKAERMQQSIEQGLKGLALLGIVITDHPSRRAIAKEYLLLKWRLARRSIASLAQQPRITDARLLCLLQLLNEIKYPAYYLSKFELYTYLMLKGIHVALTHGNSPETANLYCGFGIILNAVWGDLKRSYQFFRLAITLNESLNDLQYRSIILTMYAVTCYPWNHPWNTIKDACQKAIEVCLRTGNMLQAALASAASFAWDPETPNEKIIQDAATYLKLIEESKHEASLAFAYLHLNYRKNLLGKTADLLSLSDERLDEDATLKQMLENKAYSWSTLYYLRKGMLAYTYDDYQAALPWLRQAKESLSSVSGFPPTVECHFYYFLTLAALYPELPWRQKLKAWWELKASLRKMKRWAAYCPVNFSHKYLLMKAELARLGKRYQAASQYYEQGIQAATTANYTCIQALGAELAAKFYLSQQQTSVAKAYLKEAYYTYTKWGAPRKTEELEARYPQFSLYEATHIASSTTKRITHSIHTHTTSQSVPLDLITVIKASQALSGEIVLNHVLIKLMTIVIENIGAEHGWLILKKDDTWVIEAEGSTQGVHLVSSAPLDTLPASLIYSVIFTKKPIVLDHASSSNQFVSDPYIQRTQPKSVLCMPLLNQGTISGLLYLENNLIQGAFTPERLEIINLIATQIAHSLDIARLYQKTSELNKTLLDLNKAYTRFIPHEFLGLLEKKSITEVVAGDHIQRDMTVLFTDIRHFTALSETMTPKENFEFINQFLGQLGPVITMHNGFIDKYLGDGLMALFPSTADDALQAAIGMLQKLCQFNAERPAPIHIGIGLNSGSLMLGTVGGENRMDGTVISDVVNLASRIESLCKRYDASILITEQTYARLNDPTRYTLRKLGNVMVRGKSRRVTIYEVCDADPAKVRDLKQQTLPLFLKGLQALNDNEFGHAASHFAAILEQNPGDNVAKHFQKMCEENALHGAHQDRRREGL